MEYAMKVYPMYLENGKTEWCVKRMRRWWGYN
jgi:hypothetical protein